MGRKRNRICTDDGFMSKDTNKTPGYQEHLPDPLSRQALTRYLIIPFLVYLLWSLGTFLFAGNVHLFQQPESRSLLMYTLVCCVLVGFVLPVVLIRRAFVSGAVNMFQLGFRSFRRTFLAGSLALLIVGALVVLQNPLGPDKSAFGIAFLLLLPAGASSVMVCWVLAGTHLQALVRHGGAPLSISVGVVITAILFGLTILVLFPGVASGEEIFRSVSLGLLVAVFFFSVRDVWAACIAVTGGLVYLVAGNLNTDILHAAFPAIIASAVITMVAFAGIHWYLSQRYFTVSVTPE
jgi:hypothetical protein